MHSVSMPLFKVPCAWVSMQVVACPGEWCAPATAQVAPSQAWQQSGQATHGRTQMCAASRLAHLSEVLHDACQDEPPASVLLLCEQLSNYGKHPRLRGTCPDMAHSELTAQHACFTTQAGLSGKL